jgi:hypothetical protein
VVPCAWAWYPHTLVGWPCTRAHPPLLPGRSALVPAWVCLHRVELLEQKSKFVGSVLDGSLKLHRVSRRDLEQELRARGFVARGAAANDSVRAGGGVSRCMQSVPSIQCRVGGQPSGGRGCAWVDCGRAVDPVEPSLGTQVPM